VVWRAAVAAAPNVVAPILAAPPSFPRHWLGTQRDLNHRGDGQNALRGSMEVGSSSDRGGLAYWVHVWRPALTNSRTSRAVSQLGSQGSGNFNEQSERRRRWLLRLWAECPPGVPLWAVYLG
jgi:hypothetical protein